MSELIRKCSNHQNETGRAQWSGFLEFLKVDAANAAHQTASTGKIRTPASPSKTMTRRCPSNVNRAASGQRQKFPTQPRTFCCLAHGLEGRTARLFCHLSSRSLKMVGLALKNIRRCQSLHRRNESRKAFDHCHQNRSEIYSMNTNPSTRLTAQQGLHPSSMRPHMNPFFQSCR